MITWRLGRIHILHGTWIPAAEIVLGIYLRSTNTLKAHFESRPLILIARAQRDVHINEGRFTTRDQAPIRKA